MAGAVRRLLLWSWSFWMKREKVWDDNWDSEKGLCSISEIPLMERQTAEEPLGGVESEKDPTFKPSWKFSDKVLTGTKRQEQHKPSCRSVAEYLAISSGFCSLGWICVTSALLWSISQSDQSKQNQKCPHGCSHISQHTCTSDFANPPQQSLLSFLALHAWKWLRKTNRIMPSEMVFKDSFLSASSPALSGCSFNAFDISHERL